MYLESGGYTITPTDSDTISVTCHASSERRLDNVKVEIEPGISTAELQVRNTPDGGNFQAIIEVPRRSNLWIRLTAGELVVDDIEGDKNLELRAGRLRVDIPHPEQYGHRDASVLTGAIDASAFGVSKGGLFRSFEQSGSGEYRLHAHVTSGQIDLTGGH